MSSEVRLFDVNGGLVRSFSPYDSSFTGGVRVAVGDLTGDGIADVVTAPGPGGGPHIRAFDGRTGEMIANFLAYDGSFRGGVFPAVGPIGAGKMGIATGPDVGGGPHVRMFSASGDLVSELMAFEPEFRGGVGVSLGIGRDGSAEVYAVPGPGGGARVRSFTVQTATPKLDQLVFEESFRGGLAVSSGDWTGDGGSDIMIGARTGGGPRVVVLDGQTGSEVENFFAVASDQRDGITPVAMVTADGSPRLAAVANDPEPWVRVMGTRSDDQKLIEVDSLGPFPGMGQGRTFSALSLDPNTKTQTFSIKAIDPIASEMVTAPEPSSGLLEVRRQGDTSQAVTVKLSISGSATLSTDYTTTNLTASTGGTWTITLPANQSSATIKITAIDDQVTDPDETAILTLQSVSAPITDHYEFVIDSDNTSAMVTIADNDPNLDATQKVWIARVDKTVQENAEDQNQWNDGKVEIRRSVAGAAMNVYYEIGSSATFNSDFSAYGPVASGYGGSINGNAKLAATGFVTFASGVDRLWVTMKAIWSEGNSLLDSISFGLKSGSAYQIVQPDSAALDLSGDRPPGYGTQPPNTGTFPGPLLDVFITTGAEYFDNSLVGDAKASETGSDPGRFYITYQYQTDDPNFVPPVYPTPMWKLGGTAQPGDDYSMSVTRVATARLDQTIVQPTRTLYRISSVDRIDITPVDDSEWEGDETVDLAVPRQATDAGGLIGVAQIVIADNDPPPKPTISVTAPDSVSAERDQSTGSYRISRDTVGLQFPLTVTYEYNTTATQGAALYGIDYTCDSKYGTMSSTGTITFPAGVRTLEVKLTPIQDTVVEGTESARLTLLPSTSDYSLDPDHTSAVVAIVDEQEQQKRLEDTFGLENGTCSSCGQPDELQSPVETCSDESMAPGNRGEGGVRFSDGRPTISATDASLPGPAVPIGLSRSWSNIPAASQGSFLGNGWMDSNLPFLVQTSDGTTVAAVANATSAYHFDYDPIAGIYNARLFARERLSYSPTSDEFVFTTPTGEETRFYGFGSSRPALQRGQFKSRTDAAGHVLALTNADSAGRPLEQQQVTTTNGTTVTESILYTYGTSGGATHRIISAEIRRKIGSGSWQTIRTVGYSYYNTGDSNGNEGDLQSATHYDENGTAIDSNYYRYYASSGGIPGGIKAVLNASATARLINDYGSTTVADSVLDDYADQWYTYDSQGRVHTVVSAGEGCSLCAAGQGTTTYEYAEDTSHPLGLNTWRYKTTEMRADGSIRTVYTNAVKQVMLDIVEDGTTHQKWPTFYAYDPDGRLNLTAHPSAITGWNDALPDLMGLSAGAYSYISDSQGSVDVVDWYYGNTATATVAGGAPGRFKSVRQRHGELGTPARESAVEYLSVAGSNVVRFMPSTSYAIRNNDGTGEAKTTSSFTWGGPLGLRMDASTSTMPIVTTAQNGSGVANSTSMVFDEFDRVTWSKDAAGFLSYTEYDPATGAVIKSIADVNTTLTSDFLNLPSGWSTPSGGGLHLKSTYEVDLLGRTTKATSPNGRVDYTIYKDALHETRGYSGWNSTTNTPTGPTSVSRTDLAHGYSESFEMTATPTLSSGRPTGVESVSGLVSLSRSYRNLAGQTTDSDAYFNLTGLTYSQSATLGTINVNYYRSHQDYDKLGRGNRSITPLGTISRTFYDAMGRAVSQWIGTNDSPTSGYWSPSNPAGMTKVSETIYDNGGIGDSLATKQISYPGLGEAPRVTQIWYDWRDRTVAVKAGVEDYTAGESDDVNRPISYTIYDNLGRAIEQRSYDGDKVAIVDANADGVPDAPSETLLTSKTTTNYDELGRVYRTDVFSVSPSDSYVDTNTLFSLTWYDRRGQVVKTSTPGGLIQKYAYDGAGRTIASYITDGGNDTEYGDALNVSEDIVLEQSESTYDPSGNVLNQITRQRFHDETGAGPLGTPTTSGNNARVSYTANYYDVGDRLTTSANYGTNGGASWSRPSTAPTRGWVSYVGTDTTTKGSWQGTYGSQGYEMPGGFGTSLPSYAHVSLAGSGEYTWVSSTSDVRALQKPSPATDRAAPSWYSYSNFTIDVDLTDGQSHRVSLYMLDWENGGRAQTVEVLDAATGALIDTRTVTSFSGGKWLTWDLAGHVKIRMTDIAPYNTVVSGIFFDAASASPASPALITSVDYDSAGRQFKSIDPKGIESRTYFDDAGRTLKTIENYVDGVVGDDNDKTTEYTYNAAGMTTLTAKLTGGGHQTTEWVYGVTTTDGNGINSNDVVRATKWPDPSTGNASSSQQDTLTLNALGQTKTTTDRNLTSHTFSFDPLGRVISDVAKIQPNGIDDAVQRIDTAYDGQGNAYLITSYESALSTNPINQVMKLYNGLGQIIEEFQAHDGAVDVGGTPTVGYWYSEMADGVNNSRLLEMAYPNGRRIDFNYDSGLDDSISRLSSLSDGGTVLEGYSYLGAGTVVKRSHPESGVDLSYIKLSGESVGDAGDKYTGLDRFGRVVDQRWITAANGVAVDRYQYTYDRDGNRLTKSNLLNSSQSESYTYDNLNQIIGTTKTGTTKSWDYDALGNWDGVTTNGTTQTRTANRQNEITAISGATTPTYDAVGNMLTDEAGRQFVYDAWNRLVVVKDSGGTELVRYEYDGMTRRIQEIRSETNELYYSDQWQVIQEGRANKDQTTYVWSPVYVDAMVERDGSGDLVPSGRLYVTHDANFNVTALLDSGSVVERYTYDPFGAATARDASWTVTTPAYGWQYLHQGGRYNSESGLYSFRYREYSPTLGRWVTMDPIGYSGSSTSLYKYNTNNSINHIDWSGLYDQDVHFYMTYYIALAIGLNECQTDCSGDGNKMGSSFAIAWADNNTDFNENTGPFVEPYSLRGEDIRLRFHFRYYKGSFPRGPMEEKDFGKLSAATDVIQDGVKNCSPLLTGIGLHILQDSYSHEGYLQAHEYGKLISPDLTSNNIKKAMIMAKATYYYLAEYQKKCCKMEPKVKFKDIESKIENIFNLEANQNKFWNILSTYSKLINYSIDNWKSLIKKEFDVDALFSTVNNSNPLNKKFEEAAKLVKRAEQPKIVK